MLYIELYVAKRALALVFILFPRICDHLQINMDDIYNHTTIHITG